jgi:hypothetical protein
MLDATRDGEQKNATAEHGFSERAIPLDLP